jgi:hypothetical protein
MICGNLVRGQQAPAAAVSENKTIQNAQNLIADSITVIKEKHLAIIQDSIAMLYLVPDPNRENKFLTELLKSGFTTVTILPTAQPKPRAVLKTGNIRNSRQAWVVATIIGLLLYTAALNLLFNKEIKGVLQSFYNKQILSQVDKDSAGINLWAFIGLFLLFSLSLGLVIYQLIVYKNYQKLSLSIDGFHLFIIISIGVCIVLSLKFLLLKLIGIIFDINRLVSQYITIINLTYFNISFLLLIVAICFSLLAQPFIPYLLNTTILFVVAIFAWQYIGNSVSVISNFRFHKFYLFIYLCALEISPILILIKALDI